VFLWRSACRHSRGNQDGECPVVHASEAALHLGAGCLPVVLTAKIKQEGA